MDDVVSKFVRKSKVLYSEALDDLERGNFNKAVSGFYFSVEALANAIVYKYRQRVRGFMGRVNIISKLVSKDVGKKMLYLYELRVLADHKETLLVESDAREAEKIANYLINELRKSLSKLFQLSENSLRFMNSRLIWIQEHFSCVLKYWQEF